MTDDQEKKIVIDEDWKERAEAEKEELARKQEEKQKQKEAAQEIPPASFSLLVSGLATNALMALGQFADPNSEEKKPVIQLPIAKHHIDMLDMLETKTKGNLEAEEKDMISKVLHELRMLYVSVHKKGGEQSTESPIIQ